MKDSKFYSLLAIFIMYAVAIPVGVIVYKLIPMEFYFKLLFADIASTIIIFIFSLITKNASCYDPYWSIAPIVMVTSLIFYRPINIVRVLLFICVLGWGLRLTLNWVYTFDNLNWIDWRYRMLKEKTGKFYPVINLLGIHMFPTIVVYLCMLPVVFAFYNDVTLSPLVLIFFLTGGLSFIMQGIADMEMHKFRKEKTGTFIRDGLWKYSRHPNYLGEIMMWWSMGLLSVFALGFINYFYLLIGAIVNTLMFLFVSIPMAENHQKERKEGFLEYKKQTRMLFPIYKKQ